MFNLKPIKKIALLTSGGDSPGMNAAIRAVVRTALYHKIEVIGYKRGYIGLIDNDWQLMQHDSVAQIINRGGTILKTGRCEQFITEQGRQIAADNLRANNVDGLIVIGGDGSFAGASLLSELIDIAIIGIPATIDNDIEGTNYCIGFDTATNTAVEAIDKLRDTAEAFNRLFLVEVMGSQAGNIALNSGIASGAEQILLPEKITSIEQVLKSIDINERRKKAVHLIVVAEGDQFGIEVLSREIKQHFAEIDVRTCRLGHIQRGGNPSQFDRVQASRFGYEAVLALLKGQTRVMTALRHGGITFVAFNQLTKRQQILNDEWQNMLKVLSS